MMTKPKKKATQSSEPTHPSHSTILHYKTFLADASQEIGEVAQFNCEFKFMPERFKDYQSEKCMLGPIRNR